MSDEKEEAVAPKGSITLDTRNLIQVGALILGGALGGGGVSFASSPTEAVADLEDEVQSLKASVETVAVAAVEIKAELRGIRKAEERIEERLADHEKRIRALEAR